MGKYEQTLLLIVENLKSSGKVLFNQMTTFAHSAMNNI